MGFKKGGIISQQQVEQADQQSEERKDLPKGMLERTSELISRNTFFGKKRTERRASEFALAQGPVSPPLNPYAIQLSYPARIMHGRLFEDFKTFEETIESLRQYNASSTPGTGVLEEINYTLTNIVEKTLQLSRALPFLDQEAEKIRDTIATAAFPTFQAALKTVMSGRGASFAFDAFTSSFQSLHHKMESLVNALGKCLDAKIIMEDSLAFSSVQLTLRKDMIFSHCLVALISIFTSNLNHKIRSPEYLNQLVSIGYLAQFESLLSTSGDEMGMLEDMSTGVVDLGTVFFRLDKAADVSKQPILLEGTRAESVITIFLRDEHFQLLPKTLQEGKLIGVIPCLFTQGINETQTLANTLGDTSLQDEINNVSLEVLLKYVNSHKTLALSTTPTHSLPKAEAYFRATEQAMQKLRVAVESSRKDKKKKPSVIILAGEVARRVNGGRLTSCKSAKDRTSMSVTFEEVYLLTQIHKAGASIC